MKHCAFILALILLLAVMCVGCSETTPENVEPSIPSDIWNTNPMFIKMGTEITVDGITYSASMLYEASGNKAQLQNRGCYFVVNRINGKVFLVVIKDESTRYATAYTLDTGIVYEGTVNIAGVEITIPNIPNN